MKKIICLLLLMPAFMAVKAQRVVADKIIAIIGDKIIVESDIKNRIEDMLRNKVEVPANAGCLMLESMLASKALSQQAVKDSLPLNDEEVESEIELRIRQFIAQFGTQEALEQVAGKTIFQLKEDSREQIREQKLAELMRNKIVENISITPTEVKNFFEKIPKDSLPFYEAQVEVGQIVIIPKAAREVVDLSKEELSEMRQQVQKGEKKFELLARTYSDDEGTKADGGLFTFNRTENNVDPDFKGAAIRLQKPGDISPVVKSQFGYHILQLIEKNGDNITVRHILKIPIVTQDEFEKSRKKLDSIRAKLIAGTLSFGDAVSRYSEDDISKNYGGFVANPEDRSSFLTVDKFPDTDLVLVLKKLKLAEYSEPVPFTDYKNRRGLRILYLKSQYQAHIENFKDDYSKIAQRALEEKKENALEEWVNKRLPSYYLQIDPSYNNCESLNRWVAESAKIK
jgi:peptidyl-prolyl cis-trans isomerase SurA